MTDRLLAFAGAILVQDNVEPIDRFGELTDENGGTLRDAAIIGGLIKPPPLTPCGSQAVAEYLRRHEDKLAARNRSRSSDHVSPAARRDSSSS